MLSDCAPLTIAANVLARSSIQSVLHSPSYHTRGWQILDRWALSSPEQLRKLEADGEVILLGRLLEQQEIEHQVLSSTAGLEQRSRGLAEHEVLALHEISTEL
ncbi:hypothetical protein [Pseudomonas veronii]|uniref:hypothetical protein n=1 Tax=Pseudomonas veronii TaxID=76761 RepID=UPI00061DC99B|nr:hypothetical protein [Pseudomonas veronii]